VELVSGISTFLVTQPLFTDLTNTVCSLGPEEYWDEGSVSFRILCMGGKKLVFVLRTRCCGEYLYFGYRKQHEDKQTAVYSLYCTTEGSTEGGQGGQVREKVMISVRNIRRHCWQYETTSENTEIL